MNNLRSNIIGMKIIKYFCALCFIISLHQTLTSNALAQAGQSEITGSVLNSQGEGVAKANITVTHTELIDNAGQVFDQSIQTGPVGSFPVADSFNRALERDVSTGDIPNVFVSSFTYELPIGKGRLFKLNGVADKLLGGWSINGMILMQSGLPLAVTQLTNFNAFAGFGTQRPNRLNNPELSSDQRTTGKWLDISAFGLPLNSQ